MNELYQATLNGNENRVRYLLERGADPNQQDEYGRTPVHAASEKSHLRILQLLLKKGGNPNFGAKDYGGSTPLHLAAISSDVKTIEMLLNFGGNLKIPNNRGELPLHTGSMFNNYQVIDFLVKKTGNVNILSKSKYSALHFATSNMNVQAIAALRDNHADFNIKDKYETTPLHLVFSSWKRDNEGKIDLSTMEMLLKSGANPNIGDQWNRTALHFAARIPDGRMAKKLLEKGADLNIRINCGSHYTPIDVARKENNQEFLQVVKAYIQSKNAQELMGNTFMREEIRPTKGDETNNGMERFGKFLAKRNEKSNLKERGFMP